MQGITDTVATNSKSIAANDNRIAKLEKTINFLNRRVDELERNARPQLTQINGLPMSPNENLTETVIKIVNFIGMNLDKKHIKKTDRLVAREHSRRVNVSNGDGSNDVGSTHAHFIHNDQPAINETQSTSTAELVTDNVNQQAHSNGVNSPNENVKNQDLNDGPNAHAPPVIVSFADDSINRKFIDAYRRKGVIYTNDVGISTGHEQNKLRIFIFEHLSLELRRIYFNAKSFQKTNNYKYLWTRDGKIFMHSDCMLPRFPFVVVIVTCFFFLPGFSSKKILNCFTISSSVSTNASKIECDRVIDLRK